MESAFGASVLAFPGPVDPAPDWDRRDADGRPAQAVTDDGVPVWQVRVIDPTARRGQSEITVKVSSTTMPMIPELETAPFTPVVFEGLTVTPYVRDAGTGRGRIAYSWRATGVVPVGGGTSRRAGGES